MYDKILRILRSMELEEKVLHFGIVLCLLSLFFPWLGGQWYGNVQEWNGFGYQTGFMGHAIFIMQLFMIVMTASPLFGGPVIVRKVNRRLVRLILSAVSTIMLVSAFTILLRLTGEVSGAEIRFGIYSSLVGSAIATLYAFLQYQEQLRTQAQALFHHPEQAAAVKKPAADQDTFPDDKPAPPPPPPPLPPEDHKVGRS